MKDPSEKEKGDPSETVTSTQSTQSGVRLKLGYYDAQQQGVRVWSNHTIPNWIIVPTQTRLAPAQIVSILLVPVIYLCISVLKNLKILSHETFYVDLLIMLVAIMIEMVVIQFQARKILYDQNSMAPPQQPSSNSSQTATSQMIYLARTFKFNQQKFLTLAMMPALALLFPFLFLEYCVWLKRSSLRWGATITLWIHSLMMPCLQEVYEYALGKIFYPFMFARFVILPQLVACFPFYLLLNQIEWSPTFIVTCILLSVHSTLHTTNLYFKVFQKMKAVVTGRTILVQDEWIQALQHEHRLRLHMQAALADIWSIMTLSLIYVLSGWFYSFSFDNPVLYQLQPTFEPENATSLLDWRKWTLLIACRTTSWVVAEYMNRQYLDILASRAHIRNHLEHLRTIDPFLEEDVKMCLLIDFPHLINSLEWEAAGTPQSQHDHPTINAASYYDKFMGPYAVAINMLLIFAALNHPEHNSHIRYAFWIF